jgi:two-component system response regulator AlgR
VSGPALPDAGTTVLRALVVDDESLARTRMRTLLGDCTAPAVQCVGEAANAVQAMALVQHQAVDVALIDIHMPGADGLALARSLQALPQAPALIFVTAHAEHAVEAFDLEAADYLTKPVRLERLQVLKNYQVNTCQFSRCLSSRNVDAPNGCHCSRCCTSRPS